MNDVLVCRTCAAKDSIPLVGGVRSATAQGTLGMCYKCKESAYVLIVDEDQLLKNKLIEAGLPDALTLANLTAAKHMFSKDATISKLINKCLIRRQF